MIPLSGTLSAAAVEESGSPRQPAAGPDDVSGTIDAAAKAKIKARETKSRSKAIKGPPRT